MRDKTRATDVARWLAIEHPIIQGPMGGGPSTPELVTAVSNAGGLGSLGAAYLSPSQITEAIHKIRSLTAKPFNVNLFAGGWQTGFNVDPAPMLAIISEIHERLGLPAPSLPVPASDAFPAPFETVLDSAPPIFSFTFGIPDRDAITRLKRRRITILGTATT